MKKILKITIFVITIMLLYPKPVFAYLDPSVVTYIIQVVMGLAIAVGAVFYVYWRKAKQKVTEKLGISGDTKKEVEDEVVMNDIHEDQNP